MKLSLDTQGAWSHETYTLLDRHDLVFLSPVPDPFYGLPIGDGSTGCLIWTDERRLFLQINNTDLIDDGEVRTDGYTSETNERNTVCVNGARLAIDFGEPVFEAIYQKSFEARLSLRDATATIRADTPFARADVQAFASPVRRVTALSLTRDGETALPLQFDLERWGSRTFMYWYSGLAGSPADGLSGAGSLAKGDTLCVTQQLKGLSFAVAVKIVTGETLSRVTRGDHIAQATLSAAKAHGVTLYIAVADAETPEGAADEAVSRLNEAARAGFDEMHREHAAAWRDFWNKSFVALSPDRDYLENLWYLNLYYANCQNRGKYPAHFCNGVWGSYHDYVPWNLYFHYNTQLGIFPLDPAGHPELTETYYRFRAGQLDQARAYARDIKKAEGAFYTDVCDLKGRLSPGTCDNCTCGAQIALSAYSHYLYTGDQAFLEASVKPMIRECAAFYLSVLVREADGKYHMHKSQGYEGSPLFDDSITDLVGVRALFAVADKLFPEDERYAEVVETLAPYETAEILPEELDGEGRFVYGIGAGRRPVADKVLSVGRDEKGEKWRNTFGNPKRDWYGFPDTEMAPVFPWGLLGVKDRGTELYNMIYNSVLLHHRDDRNPENAEGTEMCNGWCMMPIYMSRMGLTAELWPYLETTASTWLIYPQGLGTYTPSFIDQKFRMKNKRVRVRGRDEIRQNLDHRFRHFDYETLPIMACAMNEALLQSYDGVVRLFPALAEDQTAAFTLYAVGGFEVRALHEAGGFEAYIVSRRGGRLRFAVDNVAQPYAADGGACDHVPGQVYEMETAVGQVIRLRGGHVEAFEKNVSRNEDAKSLGEAWLGIGKEFSE